MELGAIYTQATKGECIANLDQVHRIVGEPLLDVPFNRFGTIPCIFVNSWKLKMALSGMMVCSSRKDSLKTVKYTLKFDLRVYIVKKNLAAKKFKGMRKYLI